MTKSIDEKRASVAEKIVLSKHNMTVEVEWHWYGGHYIICKKTYLENSLVETITWDLRDLHQFGCHLTEIVWNLINGGYVFKEYHTGNGEISLTLKSIGGIDLREKGQ